MKSDSNFFLLRCSGLIWIPQKICWSPNPDTHESDLIWNRVFANAIKLRWGHSGIGPKSNYWEREIGRQRDTQRGKTATRSQRQVTELRRRWMGSRIRQLQLASYLHFLRQKIDTTSLLLTLFEVGDRWAPGQAFTTSHLSLLQGRNNWSNK